jgi:hypothetical protein
MPDAWWRHRDGQVVLVRHHLVLRALSVLVGMEELEFLRDAASEDDASTAVSSEQLGVGTVGVGANAGSGAFQEAFERLEAGTMKPVAGLGLHLTPLFMLLPCGTDNCTASSRVRRTRPGSRLGCSTFVGSPDHLLPALHAMYLGFAWGSREWFGFRSSKRYESLKSSVRT